MKICSDQSLSLYSSSSALPPRVHRRRPSRPTLLRVQTRPPPPSSSLSASSSPEGVLRLRLLYASSMAATSKAEIPIVIGLRRREGTQIMASVATTVGWRARGSAAAGIDKSDWRSGYDTKEE
ncbi:hypothetical protein NL676_013479 [Syzygium grande]|nr:hypothetical protein NL676_013479 [Syzygium grande]